jgi:hypothetical protein
LALFTNPIMGCSGKFKTANVKFGENPDKEATRYL